MVKGDVNLCQYDNISGWRYGCIKIKNHSIVLALWPECHKKNQNDQALDTSKHESNRAQTSERKKTIQRGLRGKRPY